MLVSFLVFGKISYLFFWISKNLFPKGQSPTNNQEQYKKPKAPRKDEKRIAPPLKTQERGINPKQKPPYTPSQQDMPHQSQGKPERKRKPSPPEGGEGNNHYTKTTNIKPDPTYRANGQTNQRNPSPHPRQRRDKPKPAHNPSKGNQRSQKKNLQPWHIHQTTQGKPQGNHTTHNLATRNQAMKDAKLHDKDTQGDILKAKPSHSSRIEHREHNNSLDVTLR